MNHERAWFAHQCTFSETIARVSISQFKMIGILHQVQMDIAIVEFTQKNVFHHSIMITVSQYYRFHDKCIASHYIMSDSV